MSENNTNQGDGMSTGVAKARLAELEAIVERSAQAVWDMAEALREIREDRLYKATHKTWVAYVSERWGISEAWANNAIAGTEIRALLRSKNHGPGHGLPTTVSQARVLQPVPDADKPKVWQQAVQRAELDGKPEPSKRDVAAAVKRYKEETTLPQPDPTEAARRDARTAVNDVSRYADNLISALRRALDGIDHLPEQEQESLAYRVVQLVTFCMRELEDRGLVRESVARNAIGVVTDAEVVGRIEVVA